MLKNVSRTTTISLLDFLAPNLSPKSRPFSQRAIHTPENDPQLHAKIREQILAKAPLRHNVSKFSRKKLNDTVSEMNRGLLEQNIPALLKSWQSLALQLKAMAGESENDNLHPTEDKLIKLLKKQFALPCPEEGWNDHTKSAARAFALEIARKGHADILYNYMVYWLHRRNPDTVISLYDTFFSSVGRNLRRVPATPLDQSDAAPSGDDRESDVIDPSRISVLVATVAAYAMKDSFKGAFDTYVASGIRIHHYRKYQFLQQAPKDEGYQKRVEQYLQRLETGYLVLRPPSFAKHIMHLAHPSAADALARLYGNVLDGIQGQYPYIAASPAGTSENKWIAVTETGWSAFQTGFLGCERSDLADRVWKDMADLKVHPGTTMWTGLLDFYADQRNSGQAMKTWDKMLAQGVRPDELSYRAIIAVLADDGRLTEGLQKFEEYQNCFKQITGPSSSVYNTVLNSLLRASRTQDAQNLLIRMHKEGPAPDAVTYNTFLAYYARLNDFKGLASTVTQMSDAKVQGDVTTFSTVLSALLRVGRKDATGTILNLMRKQGVEPNVATYTAIINNQIWEQTEEGLEVALNLLDRLEQDPALKPNEVTYTTIMAGLYRGRWLSQRRADEVKRDLVRRMERMKINFTLRTYHILIKAALNSESPYGYQDALAYFHQMENQRVPRVQTTWYILFGGLMQQGHWGVAKEMVRKMYLSQHQPSGALLKLVNEIKLH